MIRKKSIRAQESLALARLALAEKNKTGARTHALDSTALDPSLEEAWLILAAVSPPTESIDYLKKALEVNPQSEKARKGIRWANQKLRKQRLSLQHKVHQAADTNRKPEADKKVRQDASESISRRNFGWELPLFIIILLIGFLLLCVVSMPSFSAQAASQKDLRPEGALFKPTLTPTITPTPTPTSTPTPTPTPIPSQTPDTYYVPYTYHSWDIPEEVAEGSDLWIEIDLSNQTLYVYRGSQLISGFLVSTGTSSYKTVTGTYKIYAKYTTYTMAGPEYYLPDVPYTMFFYKGYAIHGTYWHSNFGVQMSHGCVNMITSDASWLYQNAPVGTYVFVHY